MMESEINTKKSDRKNSWVRSWWTRLIAAFLAVAMACSIVLANAVRINLRTEGASASESTLDETTAYVNKDAFARAGEVIAQFFSNPKTLEQYYQNASILIGRAQYEEALECICVCLSLSEGEDEAVVNELWLKRGCLETLTERYDEALDSFTHITDGAYEAEQLLIQAQIYDAQGETEKSARALETYVQAYPEDNDTRLTLAGVYLNLGEYAAAIGQYDAILESGDPDGSIHMQRASVYMIAGDYEASIADYLGALEAGYADPSACYAQCALASYLGQDYESVVSYGEQAVSIGSENFSYETLYYYMGLSQLNLGAYSEAIELLDNAIELGITMDDAYYYRGVCNMVTGNMEQAIADFTAAINRNVSSLLSNSYFNRGVCAADQKDYALARSDFEMVLQLEGEGELYESAKTMLDLL
jgi:tetratricopeptide (TPR) repeat protein